MTFETYQPSASLQPYIKAFHIIESHGLPLENRVLPGTSIALSFRFGGQIAYGYGQQSTLVPAASLAGLRQSARLIHYLPHSGTMVALLKEGMAPAFFRNPLHEMRGLTLELDSFFAASEIARVQDQLAGAPDHRARVATLERFLLAKLRPHEPDAATLHAVAAIHQAKGRIPMADLAERIHLSQDAFEKRFRRAVGILPKPFADIVRLQTLIAGSNPQLPVQRLALDGDYFDQAHFNHAFKRFTGLPPRAFFKQRRFW
ncbi:AraC family transcriptional regulator [Parapedobacter koreensis]|uniref:Transcriptional regulator, AraC family n=1 Tax=Parapedobacter koreensis TaxID=332977 RepID=A0A1H7Q263_9SPHI|nr:helix-turn-helix domain-containing protein [Parapedobacter koreensis]SEL41899.1 transcriptional regulator, AraC family [Parapedobacter koreensis]